ncbi:LuxR C-terminal-related transcriptional regulator [Pseudonocardia sp. NPDC049635]|uniref:LuxR C-terminal-related transcriptional regulator n=1 Tax=Pseudonocardia sp. NPDC049635 TaxID=3155506 RepID=UPI0033D63BA8
MEHGSWRRLGARAPEGSARRGDRPDLGIGANTVRTHLRNLYRKLEVSTRREAVAAGRRQSLL